MAVTVTKECLDGPGTDLMVRRFGDIDVRARCADRYVDATELCRLAGRKWFSYIKRKETKRFLKALEARLSVKAPNDALALVESTPGAGGGTWIHPQVVIHFIQWASPEFAAQVTEWVQELLATGRVELSGTPAGFVQIPAAEWEKQQGEIEHLKKAVNRLAAELESRPLMLAPAALRYTVQDRLIHRGYGRLTKKARNKITQLACSELNRMCAEPPFQAGGPGGGGPFYFSGGQVKVLDEAIDDGLEWLKEQDRKKQAREEAIGRPSLEFEVRIRRTDAA